MGPESSEACKKKSAGSIQEELSSKEEGKSARRSAVQLGIRKKVPKGIRRREGLSRLIPRGGKRVHHKREVINVLQRKTGKDGAGEKRSETVRRSNGGG